VTTGEVSVWFGIVIYMGVHSSPSGCGLTTRAMVDTLNPTPRLDTLRTDQEIHAHASPPRRLQFPLELKVSKRGVAEFGYHSAEFKVVEALGQEVGGGRCLCIKW